MFDLRKHMAHGSGMPKKLRRAGMQPPIIETYEDYQIEISERPASPISKRTSFSVRIDGGEPLLRKYLTGFLSEKSARQAAHTEIKNLEFKYGQYYSPVQGILNSLKRQRSVKRLRDAIQRRDGTVND